jgi:predicted enzyme related to lactoylglutathione lyase
MATPTKLIVFPVKDIEKAKSFYSAFLNTEPYADTAYYVGYRAGDLEIGLDPNGQDVVTYIDVDDIPAAIQQLTAAGAEVHSEAKDVGGGLQVAQVKDADGNILGLRQQPK